MPWQFFTIIYRQDIGYTPPPPPDADCESQCEVSTECCLSKQRKENVFPLSTVITSLTSKYCFLLWRAYGLLPVCLLKSREWNYIDLRCFAGNWLWCIWSV